MSESDLYGQLMVEATRLGHRLFRNNVGRARYRDARGEVFTVPYGVGGKGGSDLIGFTRDDFSLGGVGGRAIFTAIEVKQKGKKATKEQAQFLEAVRVAGGIAGIVEAIADYHKLIGYTGA